MFRIGNRDAAVMKPVDEVHGSVNRINNEQTVGIQTVLLIHFLTEEAGIRNGFAQHPDQELLNAAVVFGHNIPGSGFCLGQNAVSMQNQFCSLTLGCFDSGKNQFRISCFCCHLFLFLFSSKMTALRLHCRGQKIKILSNLRG